jgi:histidinol-phosphate aminotransferase
VRSFSKALGLAGVRLGFVAGPEAVVNTMFKVRASFDINALAIAAGEWALDHPGDRRQLCARDREKF